MSGARKKNPPVIVVGGGLGGLAAALSLWRKGVDYLLVERAEGVVPHDAGLLLQNSTSAVIGSLGLREEIKSLGVPVAATSVRRRVGGELFRIDNAAGAAAYGGPAYGIRLRALAKLFADALDADKIRTGARVEDLNVGPDGVKLSLAGGERVEGYAVVGADGPASLVRRAAGLATGTPAYAGALVWHGVAAAAGAETIQEAREIQDADRRFGHYPLPGGAVGWYALIGGPSRGAEPGARAPAADDLPTLRGAFGGWDAPIPAILEATAPEAVWRSELCAMAPLKAWTRGRATLVGEAAHPMPPNLGLHVGQVLEDAVVLGQQLAEGEGIEEGFRRYSEVRQKRTPWVVDEAFALAGTGGGGLLRAVRSAWRDRRPAAMHGAWERKLLSPPIKRLG